MSNKLINTLVSTDWLLKHLDDDNLCIIDITLESVEQADGTKNLQNGRASYEKAHIPGTQYADLLGNLSDQQSNLAFTLPSAESFAQEVSALGVTNNSQVVIYSRTYQPFATRLWWMFNAFGFEGTALLDGSFAKWKKEGKPISNEPTTPIPAKFTAKLNSSLIATLDEVQASSELSDTNNSCLIDSLPNAYFHGNAGDSYGYGRLGHIPTATNIPTDNLLNPETGEFLALDQIETIFKEAVGNLNGRHIAYCGGGIAASQNVFAMHLIGKKDIALFDGSLEEWVKQDSRPLSVD